MCCQASGLCKASYVIAVQCVACTSSILGACQFFFAKPKVTRYQDAGSGLQTPRADDGTAAQKRAIGGPRVGFGFAQQAPTPNRSANAEAASAAAADAVSGTGPDTHAEPV